MGRQIDAVDPTDQWAGGYMPWILTNGPADRCRGSYYPMGRQMDAVDPTYSLLTNGPANIDAVDPTTQWGRQIDAVDPNAQWAGR